MAAASLEQFVEDDIENIVQLFNVFNRDTHGAAGTGPTSSAKPSPPTPHRAATGFPPDSSIPVVQV